MDAQLAVRYMPLDDLQPYSRNPVVHPEEQIALLVAGMKRFGFVQPITIDSRTREVIAGHGRLAAARKAGIAEVPVIELEHLTPEQVREYRIADNQLQRRSEWDYDLLMSEVAELQIGGADLTGLGFSTSELGALLEGWGAQHANDVVQRSGENLDGIRKLIRVMCEASQYDRVLEVIRKALQEAGLGGVVVE